MLTHFRRFIALIKRQSRKIFASLGLSALITILCYLMNNCPYPYWDSLDKFTWMEYFLSNIKPDSTDTSDALFINISHDKQIVDVNFVRHLGDPGYKGEDYTFRSDTFGLHGTIDITNRETLLNFLKKAEKAGTYKYIFLDIRFEENINTKTDSLLHAQISRMRNVAYSTHSDIKDHEQADHSKAAINDYFTTRINTSFTRWQYLQDGKKSTPLLIYTSVDTIHNKTIKKWGPFYYSNGQLCQNSPFMRIPEDFRKVACYKYLDLGPEILTDWADNDIWEQRLRDKVVFVGNYEEDVHDTYNGKQPGSYLIYLAYKELCEGRHLVSWKSIGFLFVIYVIISIFIMNRKSIWQYIPRIKNIKNKLTLFVLDMFGYASLLSLLSIVFYVWFNDIYNVFFPSLIFSVLSLISSYKNKSK
ncbi:MAG: hypothetical protein IJS43_00960 [Bacteroidaceae bacterium]|nr:hypothetical protein [Bacteroidaceae bacterium]